MIRSCVLATAVAVTFSAGAALAQKWTAPVEVLHELRRCATYRAGLDGPYLVIQVTLEPGWHTFTMDNKRRAAEKLAGKPSLGIDQPTEISVTGGLEPVGSWYQPAPKDFSKPELRWFSWGFENEATFVTEIRRSGTGPAQIAIRGQACTETSCKNVDVTIPLSSVSADTKKSANTDLKKLVRVL